MISKHCVNMNTDITNLALTIDLSSVRFLFVLNEHDCVIGVLSQGDIIRAMVMQVSVSAQEIMETNFYYVKSGYDEDKLRKKMVDDSLIFVPVLDKDMKLINVVEIWDL